MLCKTRDEILSNGIIQEMDNGTIGVWTLDINGQYTPYPEINTKSCCELLGYVFDCENQKCIWTTMANQQCSDCVAKLLYSAEGNDGTLFNLEPNETATLEISLDYLFQFDCDVFMFNSGEQCTDINNPPNNQNKEIFNSKQIECSLLENQLLIYSGAYESLNYVITNNSGIITETDKTQQDFGYYKVGTSDPNSANNAYVHGYLTKDGLTRWKVILGDDRYFQWLDSEGNDTTTYTPTEATQIHIEGAAIGKKNNSENAYVIPTNNNVSDKKIAKKVFDDTQIVYDKCISEFKTLENPTEIADDTTPISEPFSGYCCDAIFNMEDFQASVTIEVELIEGSNQYVTAYEEEIFGIGRGNLLSYISGNTPDSGIIISGESGVVPPLNPNLGDPTIPYPDDVCLANRNTFLQILYYREYAPFFPEPTTTEEWDNVFALLSSWYDSNWLTYKTVIDNPNIINNIANKKIKLGIKIKDCCFSYNVLIDKIKLVKNTITLDNQNIAVLESPGFELLRIPDNKKSWVSQDSIETRNFELSWRNTEYSIKDYRLAINTKEIDLRIDAAQAIEGDVWCYTQNNICILTGTTSLSGNCDQSCGDDDCCINLDELLTTELSNINTIQEFQNILMSELIDVKNRQTLSRYPTLRMLYERYLFNSCCTGTTNQYDYTDMQNIANLVGDYWIDLVEQVVPSTTIWNANTIYRNTIFDIQKHKYRAGTTWLCDYPSFLPFSAVGSCEVGVSKNILDPIGIPTGLTPNVQTIDFQSSAYMMEVPNNGYLTTDILAGENVESTGEINRQLITDDIEPNSQVSSFSQNKPNECFCVWTTAYNCDSSFIGRVIDDNETYQQWCEYNGYIATPNITLKNDIVNCYTGIITDNYSWDSVNRVLIQQVRIYEDSYTTPTTNQYDYEVIPFGDNAYGINMSVSATSVPYIINIGWDIPIGAPDPICVPCTDIPVCLPNPSWSNNIFASIRPYVSIKDPGTGCVIFTTLVLSYYEQ